MLPEHYFSDDHEVATEVSTFTWYDSRLKGVERTGRSEWRFYYHDDFLAQAGPGDELSLVRTKDETIHALVFNEGSARLRAARLLFGVTTATDQIQLIPDDAISKQDLELVRRQIIDELELDIQLPVAGDDMDLVVGRFGEQFPKTMVMSAFAREQVRIDGFGPDETLVAWLDREEQLFRALEKVVVGKRIKQGFEDVDDFMAYSLSAQQRRKSRMGHALENHLFEMFTKQGLRFAAQPRTEGRNKPDFVFPGAIEYHNPSFDATMLVMLGAKSSAKDRWKQILTEAYRIEHKHLCTLEAGISEHQTELMTKEKVTLVVPMGLHPTYTAKQRKMLLDVQGFIDLVRTKQN